MQLKLVEAQFLRDRLGLPAQFKTDGLLFCWRRQVQGKLKRALKVSSTLFSSRHVNDEVRNQIKVDQNTCTTSERDMVTLSLDIETHTHGSLHMPLLSIIRQLVQLRCDTFLSVVVFKTEHHRRLIPGVKQF